MWGHARRMNNLCNLNCFKATMAQSSTLERNLSLFLSIMTLLEGFALQELQSKMCKGLCVRLGLHPLGNHMVLCRSVKR